MKASMSKRNRITIREPKKLVGTKLVTLLNRTPGCLIKSQGFGNFQYLPYSVNKDPTLTNNQIVKLTELADV